MATVGGLTTSTSNSIRGYGGLASGLDRDTLIEGMTYGTTSKITQQQQKQQTLEWKQAAVQNISDMMIAFANKYTATLTSSSNLFSSMFWGRNQITTSGTNSKFVSVSGTASAADAITIMGVKQMAEKAKWTSSANISNQTLTTGVVNTEGDHDGKFDVQNLVGKDIDFKYNGQWYSVYLNAADDKGNAYDYSTVDGALKAITEQMNTIEVGDQKLGDLVKIEKNGEGKIQIRNDSGNKFEVVGGSALSVLGFNENKKDITDGPMVAEVAADDVEGNKLVSEKTFAEMIAGKSLSFSYNGTVKSIEVMPDTSKLDGTSTKDETVKAIADSLQDQLDSAFGKGRILVTAEDGKLSFNTMDPSKKWTDDDQKKLEELRKIPESERTEENTKDLQALKEKFEKSLDKTSTLSIVDGSSVLMGEKGLLGVKAGVSNRVNLNAKIFESGLNVDKNLAGQKIVINGAEFTISENDTMQSLMDRINKDEKANVTISYQSASDRFTITSKENGASGTIDFAGSEVALLDGIFGEGTSKKMGADAVQGKDAVVAIKYAGSDEEVEVIRDSNSFTIDGLTIGVKGTFGYDKDDNLIKDVDTAVQIEARVNTDSIVDSVKSMVEEYNAIIDIVNKELTTKPDRDYSPLTSEQKKELSESEIKTWEEKAKEGLLFGDSDLRSLSSDLRFIVSGGNSEALRAIGITTSSTYSDNGKLTLDESKLRSALETNPEQVEKLFTGTEGTDADGKPTYNGIATNLKNVMSKYVETLGSMESKGILIRKAGSKSSPMSLTENALYKELAEIKKKISTLQTRLESERDRYIKQFTSLETLISQMNSQSSWLSQFGG